MTDSDLTDRIAWVIEQVIVTQCKDDWSNAFDETDDDGELTGKHLLGVDGVIEPKAIATAIVEELGLRQEQLGEDAGHPSHRFVTEWITDD